MRGLAAGHSRGQVPSKIDFLNLHARSAASYRLRGLAGRTLEGRYDVPVAVRIEFRRRKSTESEQRLWPLDWPVRRYAPTGALRRPREGPHRWHFGETGKCSLQMTNCRRGRLAIFISFPLPGNQPRDERQGSADYISRDRVYVVKEARAVRHLENHAALEDARMPVAARWAEAYVPPDQRCGRGPRGKAERPRNPLPGRFWLFVQHWRSDDVPSIGLRWVSRRSAPRGPVLVSKTLKLNRIVLAGLVDLPLVLSAQRLRCLYGCRSPAY